VPANDEPDLPGGEWDDDGVDGIYINDSKGGIFDKTQALDGRKDAMAWIQKHVQESPD
jgi:hypothetical protein